MRAVGLWSRSRVLPRGGRPYTVGQSATSRQFNLSDVFELRVKSVKRGRGGDGGGQWGPPFYLFVLSILSILFGRPHLGSGGGGEWELCSRREPSVGGRSLGVSARSRPSQPKNPAQVGLPSPTGSAGGRTLAPSPDAVRGMTGMMHFGHRSCDLTYSSRIFDAGGPEARGGSALNPGAPGASVAH